MGSCAAAQLGLADWMAPESAWSWAHTESPRTSRSLQHFVVALVVVRGSRIYAPYRQESGRGGSGQGKCQHGAKVKMEDLLRTPSSYH